jgi:hypothetical protein
LDGSDLSFQLTAVVIAALCNHAHRLHTLGYRRLKGVNSSASVLARCGGR